MRRKRTLAMIGVIAAVMAIFGVSREPCLSVAQSQTPGTLKPIVSWAGGFSCIEEPSCFRVSTTEAWRNLWLRHTGSTSVTAPAKVKHVPVIPEIDFSRFMVLAIFQGSGFNNHGLRIMEILDSEDELRIRCANGYYQGWSYGLMTQKVDREALLKPNCTAYGIFVLPRVSKRLHKRAVDVNIEIMRTFVRLRAMLASHEKLARRLAELEQKYDIQFKVVFEAIKKLMKPPTDSDKKGPIGFRPKGKKG